MNRAEEMLEEEKAVLKEYDAAVRENDGSDAADIRILGSWDRYVKLVNRDRPRPGGAVVLDYHAAGCSRDANGMAIL